MSHLQNAYHSSTLNSLIGQYGKVIIKPIYGSKGGITIIEKGRDYYSDFPNPPPNMLAIIPGSFQTRKRYPFHTHR